MSKTTSTAICKIIRENKVQGTTIKSHGSLLEPTGALYLNRETIEKLFEKIRSSLRKTNYVMGLQERSQPYMPVLADIDLKIEGEIEQELYTIEHVKSIVKIHQDAITEIIPDVNPEELHCVYLAKEPYIMNNYIKHGFHLQFPSIFMNKISQENHLLPRVKKQVKELELFKDLGFEDSGKAIDSNYLKVPWLMYGSKKDGPEHKPYLVKHVFNSKLEIISLEDAFKNYKIYDNREQLIKIEGNIEEYLPRILSIIPYGREVKEIKTSLAFQDEKQAEEKKEKLTKDKIYDLPNPEDEETEDICESLLKLLSPYRADEHDPWIRIGWIMHSVFQGNDIGLRLWKEFASQSDKYDDSTHDSLWSRMADRNDLTLGSLHRMAKEDNPLKYKQFISSTYGPVVEFKLGDEIPWKEYNKKIDEAIQKASDEKEYEKAQILYNKTVNAIKNDLNNYFAVINGTAKPYFMIRQVNKDPLGIKYIEYIRQTKQAFKDSYENKKCWPFPTTTKGRPKKAHPWVDIWIDWDNRRSYQSEIFQNPSLSCPSKSLNIFHGFNISRELANEKGTQDVSHFFDFIKTSWCGGNEKESKWAIDWLAHIIQNPIVKMLSAIVLRGEEGIGKGMIVQKLGEIIGPQFFIQPASIDDVLGTFNGIVANKAVVFLDEMVWGGDKQKSGILKKLITESKSSINEKNLPQRPTTTVFNLIISSNEDWIVPAGNNARRYMMLDVQNTHNKEEKDAVRLSCPYSVAKFLYERDITDFDHSNIIATSALASQKEQSAPDAHKFIIDQVKAGDLPFEDKISFETLYEQFKGMYSHNRYTRVQTFARDIKKIIDYKIYRPAGNGKRHMKFPSEEDCRKSINAYYRQDMFIDLPEEETEE